MLEKNLTEACEVELEELSSPEFKFHKRFKCASLRECLRNDSSFKLERICIISSLDKNVSFLRCQKFTPDEYKDKEYILNATSEFLQSEFKHRMENSSISRCVRGLNTKHRW